MLGAYYISHDTPRVLGRFYIEIDSSHPLWEVRSVGPLARENWVKW